MRKGVFSCTAVLAVSVTFTLALASEEKPKKVEDRQSAHPAGTTITDGNGNPVGRESAAGEAKPSSLPMTQQRIRRGQAWWPYGPSLPPYNAVGRRAEAMTEDEIQVNGVAILNVRDVEATLRLVPRDLKLPDAAQLARPDGYFLVKIAGFSRTQEQLDALKQAGAVLGEYLYVNTYIAKIPSRSISAVKALPFVSFVGDYHPAYKISPRIGLEAIPESEVVDPLTGQMKPWAFQVTLHTGADLSQALEGFHSLGIFPEDGDIVANVAQTVVLVRATPETVLSIAQLPEVKWIAEKTFPKLNASNTSPATIPMVLQNNGVFTTSTAAGWKLFNAGIDGNASGTAQIVTMMDSGLNTNMEHFAQDTSTVGTIGALHRKVLAYEAWGGGDVCVTAFDNTASDEGHGTWTSQHAVGSISNMTANPDATHVPNNYWDPGIARDARLYFQDIGISTGQLSPPADLGTAVAAAIAKGSFVQNHSWSAATNTYEPDAVNLDTALFANPDMVVTVSAGNDGTEGAGSIGHLCTAKNVICVGGVDVAHPDNVFQDCNFDGASPCGGANDLGSARGPVATFNRTKPDILGYMASSALVGGENLAGDRPAAMCQTDVTKTVYWDWTDNSFFGGTSFSAPQVAGLAALVRDYFQAGFYPSGTATPANSFTPSGSLVKAVILASGENMSTAASPTSTQTMLTRYSNDAGYGRANLSGVLRVGSTGPSIWVQNNDALGQALTKSFLFNINGNGIPLRVMLVWYDAAGGAIVKDANLRVTIGPNVYRGNHMSGGWSVTGGVADNTNNTEGVFLDQAHGLPASGSFQVEVIGANNPSGMNYSLVVSGDVANQAETKVSLDKGEYNCSGPINITVNDALATSPVSVTLVSRNSVSTIIDTKIVSCTGSSGVFHGTILEGSGIAVVDGGSLTATYAAVAPATAMVNCKVALIDGGFLLGGGCDNAAAGTNPVTGPLTNGGTNEYYRRYMDAGEYTSYTVGFINNTGAALTDVNVALSFSGPGASKMTAFTGPVHVGPVPDGALAGAVFQVLTDPSTSGLTSVNMDFDVTSPADGFTTARRLTQTRLLQANDVIARQTQCTTFTSTLAPWFESTRTNFNANPWRSVSTTVGGENRVDGPCGNATLSSAVAGNAGTGGTSNFAVNADSILLTNFQPTLRGNGPSGQPYHYTWKWHSFYGASEAVGNATGRWGAYYDDTWDNVTNPTADQALTFPITVCCYDQTLFDFSSAWNWETANTGTPDNLDPALAPPNQLLVNFNDSVEGDAATGSRFAYGHRHWHVSGTSITHRDIAVDNDSLTYDEYYAAAQPAACPAGTQPGQVAFDQYSYGSVCPTGSVAISVTDPNAGGSVQVTVSSPGTGDIEILALTLVSSPTYAGSIPVSTVSGVGSNNGTLFVLPNDVISVTYADGSPALNSTATAAVSCRGGNVSYLANAQFADNGDNDGIPDTNECVTMDITIKNDSSDQLTNAKVTIVSSSPNVDFIADNQAVYGTVPADGSATNPGSDRFSFHVSPSVACSDPNNPPTAKFTVLITADGVDGASALQTFTVPLDLNAGAGTFTYTQNFNADPGWTTGITAPDNLGCSGIPYQNDFHWCALCGNGNGGYGAWVGNAAFGTAGQNYSEAYNSSTLYTPVFTAGGTSVSLQFRTAYRTESGFDGAIVQYQVGTGTWTTLPFTTPAQTATTSSNFCSPIEATTDAWTGTGTPYTLTNAAAVPTAVGQQIKFRFRLGSDSVFTGTTFGGFGVDDVSVTGLRPFTCDTNPNTSLTPCTFCSVNANGSACDDANACTAPDVCSAGSCAGAPLTVPPEAQNLSASNDKATYSWSATPNSTIYDVVRGSVSALPVGPGGGDELCFSNLPGPTVSDATTPAVGTANFYLSRGRNLTCPGTYGFQGVNGVPGSPRVTATCP